MIEAIKEIGDYALRKDNKNPDNPIEIIVEDPASSPTYKHVLAIMLNETEKGFEYEGIRHEEYSKEKKEKYLYKKGSSKGIDFSPTSRITISAKTNSTETLDNKIIPFFKKTSNDKGGALSEVDLRFLKKIHICLESNKDIIFGDLNQKINNYGRNENGIITILLKSSEEHYKYVGELDVFKQILVQYFSEDLYRSTTYKLDSISYKQICSVCKKLSEEVYGLVTTYKFYTVDKPGFVSGGFDRSKSWKNYPVCIKCALSLEAGKQHVEEYYRYNSYRLNYYIIPKLLQQNGSDDIYSLLDKFKDNIQDKNLTIKREYGNLLSESEDDAFEMLSEQSNVLSNNILFYEKDNAAFRILLYVEDVLPSRLRKLFATKRIVENKSLFKNFTWNDQPQPFTFGNIWHFYPKDKEQDQSKYFLEITNNIFKSRKIDYIFLLKGINNKIKKDFKKGYSTKVSIFKGLQLLDYCNTLGILNNFNGGVNMDKDISELFDGENTYIDQKANLLFSEFPEFFNQPAKKAVFLQGVLNQFLFKIQLRKRGSTPFRTKLQGLNIDEKLVKKLFPAIQNKLEEYGENYYRDLEASISKYMIQAGNNWNLSKDEISFYYVLGMNLSDLFKKEGEKVNE